MEDDGPTGARTGNRGTATSRPVRAARRRRLGLGLGQGVRVAGHHHLPARLPARPCLLPDGRPDGRPRRPRLVADQPVPAPERVAALPGARRRPRAVGAVAARAEPAAAADRRVDPPGRDADLLHRRVGWDDRAVHGLRGRDGRCRQLRQVDRGSGAARATGRRQRRLRRGQHLRHRRSRRERRTDDDRLRAQPGFADGRPGRMGRPPTTWPCPNHAAAPRR